MSCAYVTLVMRGNKYAAGAIVLAQSLKMVKTKHSIICMVTDDVPKKTVKILAEFFDQVERVPYIRQRCHVLKTRRQRDLYTNWIEVSFTKWNCVRKDLFGQFAKVLFIDADIVMMKNCDEALFSLEPPAMTFSQPWCKPYLPDGIDNPYGEMSHGTRLSCDKVQNGFKSFVSLGSMVLVEPSDEVFQQLILCLKENFLYGNSKCYSGFDEQLICQTYCSLGYTFTHIHQKYNWCVGKWNWLPSLAASGDCDSGDNEAPKVYHYYGDKKPWFLSRNNQWKDTEIWWSLADVLLAKGNDSTRKLFELKYHCK